MSAGCVSVSGYEVNLTKKLTNCIRKIEKWVNDSQETSTDSDSKYQAKMRSIFATEIDLLCSKLAKGKYYDASDYAPSVKIRGNNHIGVSHNNNRQMKTLVSLQEMQGEYVAPKGVNWDKLLSDIIGIVLVDGCDKSHLIDKIRNEIMNEKEKTLNDEKKMVYNSLTHSLTYLLTHPPTHSPRCTTRILDG